MDILQKRIDSKEYDRLISVNIDSLKILLTTDGKQLQQSTKLSSSQIKAIVQEAASIIIEEKCLCVSQVPEWQRISTGCSSIDAITRGGIALCGLNEIVGPSGVGKTQFCLQLALLVQFPRHLGGLNKAKPAGVVYISTEDAFPSKRLHQLAETLPLRFGKTQLANIRFEDNVFLEHITDFEQFRRCISVRLPQFLALHKVGLIVIDSIAGIFRSENLDVNYAVRSGEFNFISRTLKELGEKFNLAVLCTNQVTDDLATSNSKTCLGLAWSNAVTCSFSIEKHDGFRKFQVVFAPDLPNKSCNFVVKENGLLDVP